MYQTEWNQIAEDVDFNLEIDLTRFRKEVPYEHRVLDFGCGYGRISNILRGAGYTNIVGIDSSSSMIERGKREFPEFTLQVLSGDKLPFPDHSFDAVVACAVFTCITDHEIRLIQIKELCRILRPDGVFHMVEFSSESNKLFISTIGVPMLHSTQKKLRELLGALQILSDEIIETDTMGGYAANSYRVFARQSLSKSSNKDALKRLL
ncbi:MAG: class I SAM-dependent methyltransferase [Agarilytica sp.]